MRAGRAGARAGHVRIRDRDRRGSKELPRRVDATCEAAVVRGLHFHDLRREFASRLLESGATLAEVQAALGHANITMTSRYLGVTDTGLQKGFERLEEHRRRKGAVVVIGNERARSGA